MAAASARRSGPVDRCRDALRAELAFVLLKNLHRRHLTESQRASAAAKIANLTHGDNRFTLENKVKVEGTIVPSTPEPVSDAKAAEMLHVSESSVERAKKLQRDGVPELSAMVDAGDVSINAGGAGRCRRNYNRYSFRPPGGRYYRPIAVIARS